MSHILLNRPEWRIFSTAIAGANNISPEGIPLSQDSVHTFLRAKENVVGVAVADGAGFAKHAREASKALTYEIVQRIFLSRSQAGTLADILNYEEHEIRNLIYNTSISILKELAASSGDSADKESLADMASTLMCFFTDGYKYVAVNIGDGMICQCGENGEFEIILAPENGHYRNQTFYITDDDAPAHMRVAKGRCTPRAAYAVMTDGTCDCMYSRSTQSPAPLLHKFCKVVRTYDRGRCNATLFDAMLRLFPRRTDDDCAIAILSCLDDLM